MQAGRDHVVSGLDAAAMCTASTFVSLAIIHLSVCLFVEFSCSLHTAKHLRGRFFLLSFGFSSRAYKYASISITP